MLSYIIDSIVCLGLGFVGSFVIMKYKSGTAARIQSTVNDVTSTVENKVDQVIATVQSTKS